MSQDESCIIPDCPTLPEVIMAGLAYKDFRMAVRGDVVHINYDSNAFQFSTPARELLFV